MQKVVIKFDNQVIKVEIPDIIVTGELQLNFHWLNGQILKAEASKRSSVEISTVAQDSG